MHVVKIALQGFMAHDRAEVTLPERGVVLVVGPNGVGKSAIIEGVATALWGKTLRGASPWRDGVAGRVDVLLDGGLTVTRQMTKGGKAHLSWSPDEQQYPTITKAQEALEQKVGAFDIWRRTHVFSSADAAHFTLATDGERKRLLESILGLERFDVALEACRDDLRSAQKEVEEHRRTLDRASERLQGAVARCSDAQAGLASVPQPEALGDPPTAPIRGPTLPQEATGDVEAAASKLARLREHEAAVAADLARLDRERRLAAQACAEPQATLLAMEKQMARLKASECPTCGQAIREEHREEYRQQIDDERKLVQVAEKACRDAILGIEAQVADLADERADLVAAIQQATLAVGAARADAQQASVRAAEEHRRAQERWDDYQRRLRAQQKLDAMRAEAEARVKECEAAKTRAVEEQGAALAKATVLEKATQELLAVEQVLGLKGVRAHVLGRALGGLEQVANRWLARIAGADLRLKLRAWSEKKTGGVSDAISLDVSGAGGGRGYHAASNGERRRLDLAVLFALAEVSAASTGVEAGSLFIDEAADGLDIDGRAAFAEVLADLAATRMVMVITHSDDIATQIPAVQRWRVERGSITAFD